MGVASISWASGLSESGIDAANLAMSESAEGVPAIAGSTSGSELISMDEGSGVARRMESAEKSTPLSPPTACDGATASGAAVVAASECSVLSKMGFRRVLEEELLDAEEHDTRTPPDTTSAERAIQTRYFFVRLPKLSINSAIFADKVGKNQKIVPSTAWERVFR